MRSNTPNTPSIYRLPNLNDLSINLKTLSDEVSEGFQKTQEYNSIQSAISDVNECGPETGGTLFKYSKVLPSLCSLSIAAPSAPSGSKRPRDEGLIGKKDKALEELKTLERSLASFVSQIPYRDEVGEEEKSEMVWFVEHFFKMSTSKNGQLYWLLNEYTPGSHKIPHPKGIEKSHEMLDNMFHAERLLVGLGFLCSNRPPYGRYAQNQDEYMQNQAGDPMYNPDVAPKQWECPSEEYVDADLLIGRVIGCIERRRDVVAEKMNEAHSPFVHSYDLLVDGKNLYNSKCKHAPTSNPNADMAAMFRSLMLYRLEGELEANDPVDDIVPFLYMIQHKIFAVGENLKDTNDRSLAFEELEGWCERTTVSLKNDVRESRTTAWLLKVCELVVHGLKSRLLSSVIEENGAIKTVEFPETRLRMPSNPTSYYCGKEEVPVLREPMPSEGIYDGYERVGRQEEFDSQRDWITKVNESPYSLESAPNKYKRDKEVVLAAVQANPLSIKFALPEMNGYNEVVRVAMEKNAYSIQFVSPIMDGYKDLVLDAVRKKPHLLAVVPREMQKDKDVAVAAVEKDPFQLHVLPCEMRDNREVALAAVKKDPSLIESLSPEMDSYKEVVLAAVQQNGMVLRYASDELRDEKDVVLSAIKNNVNALRWASDRLKGTQEVMEVVSYLKQI